jgi:hypothetical protein
VTRGGNDGDALATASATTTTAGPSGKPTTAPSTSPSTNAPTTTKGSAPSTNAPTTVAPTTTASATTTPGPSVGALSATPTSPSCTPKPTTQIKLTWSTTGAASVRIGIENPGTYQAGLPASGSLDVPFAGCSDKLPKKYYVFAVDKNGNDLTSKTITVTPGP